MTGAPGDGWDPAQYDRFQDQRRRPFAQELTCGPAPRFGAVLRPEEYAVGLHQLGFTELVVRLEVYGHVLESTDAVVEWVKGTLFTPYREGLDRRSYDAFVDRYRARLLRVLGDQRPYFYTFKRILCWGRLPP